MLLLRNQKTWINVILLVCFRSNHFNYFPRKGYKRLVTRLPTILSLVIKFRAKRGHLAFCRSTLPLRPSTLGNEITRLFLWAQWAKCAAIIKHIQLPSFPGKSRSAKAGQREMSYNIKQLISFARGTAWQPAQCNQSFISIIAVELLMGL